MPAAAGTERVDDAERLFRTMPVDALRQVQARTRAEIDDKKHELRVLVGERYRDFLSSADQIIDMRSKSDQLLARLQSLSSTFEGFTAHGRDGQRRAAQEDEDSRREVQHRTALLLKYLVDIPEQVWSALDSHHCLDAVMLYTIACKVYESFGRREKDKSYPFLLGQWSAIRQFRPQILDACRARLRNYQHGAVDTAQSLAALQLLEGWDVVQALDTLLALRKAAMAAALENASETSLPQQFEFVVHTITLTLAQVALLFAQAPGADGGELYPQQLDALFHSPAPNGVMEGNVRRWAANRHVSAVMKEFRPVLSEGHLAPVSREHVAEAVTKWVASVTELVHSGALSAFRTAASGVHLASAQQMIFQSASKPFESVSVPFSWQAVCEHLLGRPVNLWSDFFRSAFLDAAKALVQADFDRVQLPSIDAQLNALGPHDTDVGAYMWLSSTPTDETLSPLARGISASSVSLAHALDQQLAQILRDLAPLLKMPLGEASSGAAHSASTLELGKDDVMAIREATQEVCRSCVTRLAEAVGSQIPKASATQVLFLGRLARALAVSSPALKSLLCLVSQAKMDSAGSRVFQSRASMRQAVEAQRQALLDAQQVLGRQYFSAYAKWVDALTTRFAGLLRESAARDAVWKTDPRSKMWEDVLIREEAEDGTEVVENVPLPSHASGYVTSFLFALSREINRAGSHSIDRSVIVLLRCKLAECILDFYQQLLAGDLDGISEPGFVQLLFDARFLFVAMGHPPASFGSTRAPPVSLGGHRGHGHGHHGHTGKTPDIWSPNTIVVPDQPIVTEAAASEWRRKADAALVEIQGHIDPIDLAMFEAHLSKNVTAFYHRSRALHGIIMQINPAGDAARHSLSFSESHNVLKMASVSQRFSYLPITMPSDADGQQQHQQQALYGPGFDWSASALDAATDPSATAAATESKRSRALQQFGKFMSPLADKQGGEAPSITNLFASAQKGTSGFFSKALGL